MVMSMRKEYKNREKEKADKESLVTMQQLKLNTGAINRLTDVQMKPTVGGRGRRSGTLELCVLIPLSTLLYGEKGYYTGTRVLASRYGIRSCSGVSLWDSPMFGRVLEY